MSRALQIRSLEFPGPWSMPIIVGPVLLEVLLTACGAGDYPEASKENIVFEFAP